MEITVNNFLLALVVTQFIHFFLLSLLYLNPIVDKIYKSFDKQPTMRKWEKQWQYVLNMFLFTFLEIIFIGIVFILIVQMLPENFWQKGILFGLIIAGVRIYPRFISMYMQTNYPGKLLAIELINGTLGSIIIGLCLSWFF